MKPSCPLDAAALTSTTMTSERPVDPSDPNLIVRRVLPVDLRATCELIIEQLRGRGRAPDVEQARRAVLAALEDAHNVLVVGAYHEGQPGFAHGKMVGVLSMNVLMSLEQAGEIGWIETLHVKPAYRRLGLAARLIGQARTWGTGRGLRALEVEISEEHEAAAAEHLYRKHGFNLVRRSRMTLSLA